MALALVQAPLSACSWGKCRTQHGSRPQGPTQRAGSHWTLLGLPPALGGGPQGGWWCHKWPQLCTPEDYLMRSLPYLSPALLLFHPLHWVSCSGLFSGARLGKEGFMRIVAKAYFFL